MRIGSEDYYAFLRLKATATPEEIHRAYRALALRYHPDRNPAPEAQSIMAQLNEAYSVLSDASRRRKYDAQSRMSCSNDLALPIVIAAHDALLRQNWTVLQDDGSNLVLEQQHRHVRVIFMDRLTNEKLRKFCRQYTEFGVILAVELENPLNLCLQIAIIDLVRSRHYGAPFPDDGYRALFQSFVSRGNP